MEPTITVLGSDRTPQGPFRVFEVIRKIEAGELRGDTLAHTPGLANWLPVNQVLAQINAQRSVSTLPPAPGYFQPNAYAINMAVPSHRYASIPLRFAAYVIDRLILMLVSIFFIILCFIPLGVVVFANPGLQQQFQNNSAASDSSSPSPMMITVIVLLYAAFFGAMVGTFIVDWLYHAWLESGKNEGTWGKQMMGIYVTDQQGKQISFLRATGRHFSRVFLTNATCMIGYIIALFGDKKQALHDLVASTVVIER